MRDKQNGAALILSLLLLLVLTLLALSSMQGSVMQQRMVSGLTGGIQSLEIAESGLRDAEEALESMTIPTVFNIPAIFDGTNGLYGTDDDPPDPLSYNWADSTDMRSADAVGGVTPRYFIQHLGDAVTEEQLDDIAIGSAGTQNGGSSAETQAFRIVIWTGGESGESQRVLEAHYVRNI
ncbi:MAG: PilX N-terminal domain-containing pilus assembly protein [Marinobacter sp.]|nr:PilX N-terminal domain-containing pilus assembly protein [Marinobacter sp.]